MVASENSSSSTPTTVLPKDFCAAVSPSSSTATPSPCSSFPSPSTLRHSQISADCFQDATPQFLTPLRDCAPQPSSSDYHIFHELNEGSSPTEAPRMRWPIVFLGFLNIFVETAVSSAIIPVLPKELGLDEFREGVVLAVGAVTASIFGPLGGWLSDECGWALTLVWFYPLVIGSAVLMLYAKRSFWNFVIARLVAGMASGFMYPSNFCMVVATHSSPLRSSAVGFTLAGDIGSLVGPLIGGYLYDLGGSVYVFSVLIALSVSATVVFFITLPSSSSSLSTAVAEVVETPAALPLTFCSPLARRLPSLGRHLSVEIESFPKELPAHSCASSSTFIADSDFPSSSDISPVSLNSVATDRARSVSLCGSPPPPYVYNLNKRQGVLKTLRNRIDEFKVLCSWIFLSRCAALFYCWGVALSLQAILPIIWYNKWLLSPSTIGLLFAPLLIFRVSFSAFFPFFSDKTNTPLRTLIALGLLVCTIALVVLAALPSASPTIQAGIVAFVGMGLGLADSCITAWAGSADFKVSQQTLEESAETSEAYRGRAFALLALACDCGTLVGPLISTLLAEYIAFSAAFVVLGMMGVTVVCLSVYCDWQDMDEVPLEQRALAI